MKKSKKVILSIIILVFILFSGYVTYKSINGIKVNKCSFFCSGDIAQVMYGWQVVKYYLILGSLVLFPIIILGTLIYFTIDLIKLLINKNFSIKVRKANLSIDILALSFSLLLMFISVYTLIKYINLIR